MNANEKRPFLSEIYSSIADVTPKKINGKPIDCAKMPANGTYSFKVTYSYPGDGEATVLPVGFSIKSSSDALPFDVYKIGNVPVVNPVPNNLKPEYFVSGEPSLYPDPLFLRDRGSRIEYDDFSQRYFEEGQTYTLNAVRDVQALWVEINPDGARLAPGKYRLTCVFYDLYRGNALSEMDFEFEVLDKEVPESGLKCTNWFYCDALADVYGETIFSERLFSIIGDFVETAAKHGINMILTPAFTPPLDTQRGKERKTVQLVRVTKRNGVYSFDFSLFERFVLLCKSKGIRYFEHSHLFTQWGAGHAPKIVAEVDGETKRIFGWDTDARSAEYADFLRAYIPALLPVLDRLGIRDKTFFHVSDEPQAEHLDNYRFAASLLRGIEPSLTTFDAMSNYSFYEGGTVDIPVVREISPDLDKFVSGCENFWIYYTGGVIKQGNANRVITLPQARNRLLGLHLYLSNAKGFLHWGYNYYYDVLTHGIADPFADPCFYLGSPGTSYVVYPGRNGKPIPSQRLKVMKEAFDDYALLKTLENKIGRAAVLGMIEEAVGRVGCDVAVPGEGLLTIRDRALELL